MKRRRRGKKERNAYLFVGKKKDCTIDTRYGPDLRTKNQSKAKAKAKAKHQIYLPYLPYLSLIQFPTEKKQTNQGTKATHNEKNPTAKTSHPKEMNDLIPFKSESVKYEMGLPCLLIYPPIHPSISIPERKEKKNAKRKRKTANSTSETKGNEMKWIEMT